MSNKNDRIRLKQEAAKCTLCGNCRSVCPVFQVHKKEFYCTRGRANIIAGFLNDHEHID